MGESVGKSAGRPTKRDREAEQKIAETIARNIRFLLKERGLSQADFAQMAGTYTPTVSRHLVVSDDPAKRKHLRCPSLPLFLRYCDALHVSADVLLGRSTGKQWVDPDIQAFFEENYANMDPEARSWCRNTIDFLRRYAARRPVS